MVVKNMELSRDFLSIHDDVYEAHMLVQQKNSFKSVFTE